MLANSRGILPEYNLPDDSLVDYLVGYLFEIGAAKFNGVGYSPCDWPDIVSWRAMTGIELAPEEASGIIKLSGAYSRQLAKSKDVECLAPNVEELPDEEVVESKLKSMFSMLRSRK